MQPGIHVAAEGNCKNCKAKTVYFVECRKTNPSPLKKQVNKVMIATNCIPAPVAQIVPSYLPGGANVQPPSKPWFIVPKLVCRPQTAS